MKDLPENRTGPPRVEAFLVNRGEQLISSLHVRNKNPASSEFGTANIASSTLHQARYHIN
jgi:hypothetical protein